MSFISKTVSTGQSPVIGEEDTTNISPIGPPLAKALGYKASDDVEICSQGWLYGITCESMKSQFQSYFDEQTQFLRQMLDSTSMPSYKFKHKDGHLLSFTPILVLQNLVSAKALDVENEIQKRLSKRYDKDSVIIKHIQDALENHQFIWYYQQTDENRQCLILIPTEIYTRFQFKQRSSLMIAMKHFSLIYKRMSNTSSRDKLVQHFITNKVLISFCRFMTSWVSSVDDICVIIHSLAKFIGIPEYKLTSVRKTLFTTFIQINSSSIGTNATVSVGQLNTSVSHRFHKNTRQGTTYHTFEEIEQHQLGWATLPLLLISIVSVLTFAYFYQRGNHAIDSQHPDNDEISKGINQMILSVSSLSLGSLGILKRLYGQGKERSSLPNQKFERSNLKNSKGWVEQ